MPSWPGSSRTVRPGAFDQTLAGRLGGDRPLGLDQDRLAVAVEDRDPHAGRADVDRVVPHDLAGLVDHLHLFLGVAVGQEVVDLGDAVERDRVGELATGAGASWPATWASVCDRSSCIPFWPAPETDW